MWILVILILILIIKKNSFICFLAKQKYGKGDIDGAEKLYEKAFKKGSPSADHLLYYGYILLRKGKLENARKVLGVASMSKGKPLLKARIKAMRALVIWKEGDIDTAIQMLEEVISKFKNTSIYQDLGLLYTLKGDKEKALSFNKEAYDFNSDDHVIMDNLAEAYALCGEVEKSEEIYKDLLGKEPRFAEAYWGYGELLIKKGEKEKGLELMRKSLEKRITFLSILQKEEIEELIKKYE